MSVHAADNGLSEARSSFLASNPNNGWACGFIDKSGEFIPYNTTFKIDDNTVGWCLDGMPGVFGDVTINFSNEPLKKFGILWEPGQVTVNPGTDCQAVVVRWTAPETSQVRAAAAVKALVDGGGKVSVSVAQDGSVLTDDSIAGNGFSEVAAVSADKAAASAGPVQSSSKLSVNTSVVSGGTVDFIFASVGELRGGHIGAVLTIDATGPAGIISYNASPMKAPAASQVASAAGEVSK